MEMDLKNKRTELVEWLKALEDKEMIAKISELKKAENQDWWHNLNKTEKESIELGISDANEGKLKTHSEAKKIYERWL